MGCPTFIVIGKTLTFSITTHDPDTGILTDADAVPDYWVYEDETGVSINANTPDEDVMAKLDDAHTTGFYAETLTCSAANGYKNGKTYTIYIEATVAGDKGGISFAFTAYDLSDWADAFLNRNMATGTDDNDRSPRNALRFLRNKWSVAGTTLTVTKEDDSTEAWTSTVAGDSDANPIVSSDPT